MKLSLSIALVNKTETILATTSVKKKKTKEKNFKDFKQFIFPSQEGCNQRGMVASDDIHAAYDDVAKLVESTCVVLSWRGGSEREREKPSGWLE